MKPKERTIDQFTSVHTIEMVSTNETEKQYMKISEPHSIERLNQNISK